MIYINDSKHRLYLVPILILSLSLIVATVNSLIIVMLAFGYLWSWGLYNEKIYTKVNENFRYRFSFLKLYSRYGSGIYQRIEIKNAWLSIFLKSLLNGIVVVPHYLLTQNIQVFIFVAGTLFFETLRLMFRGRS